MGRTIISPSNGGNVTAATQNTLLNSPNKVMFNLYSFSNRIFWVYNPFNFCAFWSFTDAPFPISLDYLELYPSLAIKPSLLNNGNMGYLHGNTSSTAILYAPGKGVFNAPNDGGFKHGSLSYSVGLEANDLDVTWMVDDTADYFLPFGGTYGPMINPPVNILPMKQAMAYYRAFDDCPFWIHRAVFSDFPRNGGTLLGTTLMWRGYVRKTEAAPDYLKISLGSLMQIVQDTQVPGQLIQANARTNPYLPFPNVGGTVIGAWPVSSGSITRVSAVTYTFEAVTTLAENQLEDCWLTFQPAGGSINFAPQNGLPPESTPGWRIQSNTAGGAGSSINVTFYNPPVVPGFVFYFNVYSPNSQTRGAPGFPYVPPPEQTSGF